MCCTRLKELQVTTNSRVAVVTGTTGSPVLKLISLAISGQAIFVHLACSLIGCSAVAVNGYNAVGRVKVLS